MNSEKRLTRRIVILTSIFCLLTIVFASSYLSSAQTIQSNFQSARSAISAAYVQIYKIEHNGGNASSFAAKLDQAIALYNKAELENASNPSQAILDLQNSTQIANSVFSQSAPMVQRAESQKRYHDSLVIAESAVVVIAAILLFFFGDRIYDSIWLYQRKEYVVKRGNG